MNLPDLWSMESDLIASGYHSLCGIDEAGRGPLAGPVCAAAVMLPPGLVLPGLNDSEEQVQALCGWMVENGLQHVPLHFSRYSPRFKMASPGPTPKQSLVRAREVALALGIETVYLGNV